MATATEERNYTTEDLLAMPDDGVERWIIRGKLREKPSEFPEVPMTVRNRHHCRVMSLVVTTMVIWTRTQPHPRGHVYSGEAGVHLRGIEESTVGIDVAYATADVVAIQSDDNTTLLDGIPTLAVEILSPNDTVDQINEKVEEYLSVGVPAVWEIDPYRRTVILHRPHHEPEMFNVHQRLPEHPDMPGFTPAVIELFE